MEYYYLQCHNGLEIKRLNVIITIITEIVQVGALMTNRVGKGVVIMVSLVMKKSKVHYIKLKALQIKWTN